MDVPDELELWELSWRLGRERRRVDKKKLLMWAAGVVAVTVLLSAVLFRLVLGLAIVRESSMVPRLNDGDLVLYSRLSREFRRGDVIVFHRADSGDYVKRVIGVGGDVVEISRDFPGVTIGGRRLDEPYLHGAQTFANGDMEFPLTVPDGSLFVLGDNREVSLDSRSSVIGLVRESEVTGKLLGK